MRSSGDDQMLAQLTDRVRAEFLEMPGLQLTAGQARRLWGLEEAVCDAILETLVQERFLRRTRDGAFARYDGTA